MVASVFNMAGADWPEDIAFWREAMAERGIGERHRAERRARRALYRLARRDWRLRRLRHGRGDRRALRDGRIWHTSYWQDESHGSTHLGQKTLFAVYRSELGLEPPTTLDAARAGLTLARHRLRMLLHRFHNRLHNRPMIDWRLAPILLDEADAGESGATGRARTWRRVGKHRTASHAQGGTREHAFPLVLAGGVFRHSTTVLEDAIVARIRPGAPNMRPVRSPTEPIIGVLLQALSASGVTIDQPLLDHLMHGIPPDLLMRRTT